MMSEGEEPKNDVVVEGCNTQLFACPLPTWYGSGRLFNSIQLETQNQYNNSMKSDTRLKRIDTFQRIHNIKSHGNGEQQIHSCPP